MAEFESGDIRESFPQRKPANELLTSVANEQRSKLTPLNEYPIGEEYGATHENAISDGDDKGKGEAETIGGKTDIKTRTENTLQNIYTEGNGYGAGHGNALSDGDEPGKGKTETVGGKTDIKTRSENSSVNQYGPNNTYLDNLPE